MQKEDQKPVFFSALFFYKEAVSEAKSQLRNLSEISEIYRIIGNIIYT